MSFFHFTVCEPNVQDAHGTNLAAFRQELTIVYFVHCTAHFIAGVSATHDNGPRTRGSEFLEAATMDTKAKRAFAGGNKWGLFDQNRKQFMCNSRRHQARDPVTHKNNQSDHTMWDWDVTW